jgi:hypothetical protein
MGIQNRFHSRAHSDLGLLIFKPILDEHLWTFFEKTVQKRLRSQSSFLCLLGGHLVFLQEIEQLEFILCQTLANAALRLLLKFSGKPN